MPTIVSQARFRGPANLDLTGIEGLGDAIAGVGKGLRTRRALDTLADLGLEATRRGRKEKNNRDFERGRVAFAQREAARLDGEDFDRFVSPPDPESRTQRAVLEASSEMAAATEADAQSSDIALINEARAAIRLGARPSRVLKRLREMGVNLDGAR